MNAVAKTSMPWDGAAVRRWLEARIAAARADQVSAEKFGRERQDDCDKAAAEEMVCAALWSEAATNDQPAFIAVLKALAERDEYIWRGIYNDARFDRHARTCIRMLMKMAKANEGFGNLTQYQKDR